MSFDDFIRIGGEEEPRLVLLPGWGTDWRIFRPLELPAGTLLARVPRPRGLMNVLQDLGPGETTLAGWSLGGFYAAQAAARHPKPVRRLVLVGMRRSYPAADVDEMLTELEDDPEQCLRSFYRRCFLPAQRDDYRRFRAELMPEYLESPDAARLQDGLEYLREVELTPDGLPRLPTSFVHGVRDTVAPVQEAQEVAAAAPRATLRPAEDAGHAAFLSDEFRTLLDDA